MTEPMTAPAAPQQVPMVVAVPAQQQRQASAPQPKRPPAWAKPPVLATGALAVVVVELAAYAALGLTWWLVANGALGLMLFGGGLVWRRRGQAGPLGRLMAARRGGMGGRTTANRASPLGGGGRGRAGGPFGGRGATGGLRARLPRLLGGARGRQSAGRAGGGLTAPGPGRRGLLAASRGRGGQAAGPAGVGAAGSGGRRGGLLAGLRGRSRGAGAAGGSIGGTSGGRRGLLAGLRDRRGARTSGAGSPGGGRLRLPAGGGRSSGGPTAGRAQMGGRWNPFTWKGWAPAGNTKATPESRKLARELYGKPSPRPAGQRGQAEARTATDTSRPVPAGRAAPVPVPPRPRHNKGGRIMSGPLSHSDDVSLQRWGANLKDAEAAAQEVQRKHAEAAAAAEQFRAVFGKIAQQGENELPASNRLMADIDSVLTRAKGATTPGEWGSIAADCAVLPTRYQQEHETDEDRLHASRKSRQAEKRADITAAEQDN